ncbi:MAG TPA: hypothetical protein VFM17_04700 [Candidatus Eisenbacteria bacterium]|nr:hypothetical protein [Candidatus Eisenbacteria bacterium]
MAREPAPARAGWLGAVWGMGHSSALLAASFVIVVLRIPVPPRVATMLELGVAAMLIVLGIHSILTASDPVRAATRPASARRPFAIGLIHGLAGSGGLALLVLPAIRDPFAALAYVGLFGLGSIGGMALWSALLAWPLASATRRSDRAARWIPAVSGIASVSIGLLVVVQSS